MFGRLAGARGLTKSMPGLIDLPPFTAQAMTHHELDVAGLMTARGICSLIAKKADQGRRLLILETMAPRLPVDKLMTQREARDALEGILGPQGDLRMSAWFQSYAAIMIPGADVWGAATGEWAATVTLVQKVGHVQAAVMRDEQQSRDKVLYSILLCMVSFAMRGDISQKKLAKFQTDLLTTMPCVANLTRDDVALT
ncbi:hypothetical protein CesoFtcFv8_008149 [Champsocephalus esox]|uniref:Uncharacterized protein n=1 Tax=Champsocephalus esox TaxID=159716 RepID=A0AAN8CF02_9TELE|nr:hypothetical protein CesoFtcFv8_008149 [Champsocephalus esox]